MALSTIIVAICIFTAIFCLVAGALLTATDEQGRHRRQMKKRLSALGGLEMNSKAGSLLKATAGRVSVVLQERIPKLDKLKLSLIQAGEPFRLETFLVVLLGSAAVFMSLGLLNWGLPGALAGGVLGGWLPLKFLASKKRRRFAKFESQLPDALELLARGLKAGHSFSAGLQLVADELAPPLAPEFFKTYKEHNHGLDLNTALFNLCQRIDLQDLRFFTTAVIIQRETGGNLAEILDKIAALIRERFKLRNQVKALTAEGRLSGLVLTLLPPATALALYFMNPGYISLLWQSPRGRMMAMVALSFQALGIFSVRKITRIKV